MSSIRCRMGSHRRLRAARTTICSQPSWPGPIAVTNRNGLWLPSSRLAGRERWNSSVPFAPIRKSLATEAAVRQMRRKISFALPRLSVREAVGRSPTKQHLTMVGQAAADLWSLEGKGMAVGLRNAGGVGLVVCCSANPIQERQSAANENAGTIRSIETVLRCRRPGPGRASARPSPSQPSSRS